MWNGRLRTRGAGPAVDGDPVAGSARNFAGARLKAASASIRASIGGRKTLEKPSEQQNRHSPRYIAGLALAALGILVVGSLLKPRKAPSETVPPLSQTETQRLLRLAQRQALDTMTEHFSVVAADVASQVVPVGEGTLTGVAWSGDLVVTAGRPGPAAETTTVTTPSGDQLVATRAVAGPQLPLVAYQTIGLPEVPPARREGAAEPSRGEWILAVWRKELDYAFVPGHYLETQLTSCGEQVVDEVFTSLGLSPEMAGGGFFDLDGSLIGVILPCAERHAAVSPKSVSRLLTAGRTFEGRLLARTGMRVVPLTDGVREHLGARDGVLVSEVWSSHPAAVAGLRPGDVVQEVDEQTVRSPDDLQPLLLPAEGAGRTVSVRRGRRRVEVTLDSAANATAGAGQEEGAGVRLESPATGYRIGAVVPGSRGDEAGLRAGDRIVRIDNAVPRSPAQVERVLSGRGPAFVELERGARRFGLLLE